MPFYEKSKKPSIRGRHYWGIHVPKTLKERLGAALQYSRINMGLTQRELAEYVEMSETHLGAIERGTGTASILMLTEILEKCQIRAEVFLLLAARFGSAPPVTVHQLPVALDNLQVLSEDLEGLVGALDGVLNDVRARVDAYSRLKGLKRNEKGSPS